MSQANQPSENSKAIVGAIKFFAACIILAAVVYSEILFLGIIGSLFPSGPLAIGAMIGAVTTGLSIIALCLGKSHWFRPGQQLIVAWIFTGIEVAVLIANDILAYQLHVGAQLDQFTSTWKLFCVATPALSLVGWILLFYFSPERTIMHKRMELEDRQQKAKIDLDTTVHRKAMDFHYRAIDMVGSGMEAQIQQLLGPITELAARQKLAQIASDLTGTHISHNELTGVPPKQISGKVVEANPVVQAASRDHTVDPHGVKAEVKAAKLNPPQPLGEKLKGLVNFSIPETEEEEKIEIEEEAPEEEKIETEEEKWKPGNKLPDNYLDWTDMQWKQAKDDLDAFEYAEKFDKAFPDEQVEEKPAKKKRGRKAVKQED